MGASSKGGKGAKSTIFCGPGTAPAPEFGEGAPMPGPFGGEGAHPALFWYNPDMAANLTPQYMEAEKKLRTAVTPAEKIEIYEELLRLIPKHKGTEKMVAQDLTMKAVN